MVTCLDHPEVIHSLFQSVNLLLHSDYPTGLQGTFRQGSPSLTGEMIPFPFMANSGEETNIASIYLNAQFAQLW